MLNFKLSIQRIMWTIILFHICGMPLFAQKNNKPSSFNDSVNLHELVVTSERTTLGANHIGSQINNTSINKAIGRSLASLLEEVSGLSSIQTGTIVAKPVIHGMYGNRILMVNNGARLTGQQWGPDHAPEVDKSGYSRIEVIKGAEAIKFGSEALGGIILMQQAPLPYNRTTLHGDINSLYSTNGHRYGMSAHIESAIRRSNWAWRLHANIENGGDRSTAHYLLNNTGTRENDISLMLGYNHGDWCIESGYSLFSQKLGVMLSAQMGNEILLQERINMGKPVEINPFSRKIGYPHQKITHQTAFIRAKYSNLQWGQFNWQITFQSDDRLENRIRRMNHSDIPTVSLHLRSLQNAFTWQKGYGKWSSEAGLMLLNTDNHNERGTGVVPIIPNYTELMAGGYFIQKHTTKQWGAEAGIRADYQLTKADGYDWTGQRYGGQRHFTSFTYQLGAHWHINPYWKLTSHLGAAWRPPHVYELYSNGNELGAGMFVKGDSTLKSEQSYKWVLSADYHTSRLKIKLDTYLQWIDNYIYDQPTHHNIVVISGAYPVFQYQQTSAFFRGADLDIETRPIPSLCYRVITSMIWANEQSTHNYLPYIPSFRLTHSVTWNLPWLKSVTPRITLTHRYVARQNRFDPNTDLISFAPPSYNIFNIELSARWQYSNYQSLYFTVAGDNILNREYKEYTNRSRYYAHDMGRDIRCIITWNF